MCGRFSCILLIEELPPVPKSVMYQEWKILSVKYLLTSMAKQMSEKLLCGINGLAMILVVIYFDLCIGFLPIILLYYVRLQPGVSGN